MAQIIEVSFKGNRRAYYAADAEDRSTEPGRAYLRRKKLERTQADESKRYLHEMVAEVRKKLSAMAEGSADLETKPGAGASKLQPAARMAFLIQRKNVKSFRKELEKLARQFAPQGLRFELTGPWPAYNFVE